MTEALSRRRLLSATVALGGAAVWAAHAAPSAVAQPAQPPSAALEALERANDVVIGVFATDLGTGRTVAYRSQDTFAMCSTFKAYLAGLVLSMVGRGERSLNQRLFIDPAALKPIHPVPRPRRGPR